MRTAIVLLAALMAASQADASDAVFGKVHLPFDASVNQSAQTRNQFRVAETKDAPQSVELVVMGEYIRAMTRRQERGTPAWEVFVMADRTKRAEFDAFRDAEWQNGPTHRGRFRVRIGADSVDVAGAEDNPEPSQEAQAAMQALFSGPSSAEILVDALGNSRWPLGSHKPLPAEVASWLQVDDGRWTLKAVRTQWHRRVAQFRIEGRMSADSGPLFSGTPLHIDLIVDINTARPLAMLFGAQTPQIQNENGRWFTGFTSTQRTWWYSDLPNLGLSINVIPQTEPAGDIHEVIAVGGNSELLAITSTVMTAGGRQPVLTLWHIPTRSAAWSQRVVGTRLAHDAETGMILVSDEFGFIEAYLVSGRQARQFGVHRPSFDGPQPSVMLAAGVYPLALYDDGTLRLFNLGWDAVATQQRALSTAPVAATLSEDASRLYAVDAAGVVEIADISYDIPCGESGVSLNSYCDRHALGPVRLVRRFESGVASPACIKVNEAGSRIAVHDGDRWRVFGMDGVAQDDLPLAAPDFAVTSIDQRSAFRVESGLLRVVDIGTDTVIHTIQPAATPVLSVKVGSGAGDVVTLGAEGGHSWNLASLSVTPSTEPTVPAGEPGASHAPSGKVARYAPRAGGDFWNPDIPLVTVRGQDGAHIADMQPLWDRITALAFSDDGGFLIGGTDGGQMVIWHTHTGTRLATFQAHQRKINSVVVREGRIWSGSDDGSTRVWDIDAARTSRWETEVPVERVVLEGFGVMRPIHLIATMVAMGSADFVVALPDGYYMATPGALDGVSFLLDGEVMDYREVDLWLNRPDIVLERLGLGTPRQRELLGAAQARRAERNGVTAEMPDYRSSQAPSVAFTVRPPSVTSDRRMTVPLQIVAGSEPVVQVQLYVNGVALPAQVEETQEEIALSRGLNRIEARVVDRSGRAAWSEPSYVRADFSAPDPTLWIYAVGVSEYQREELTLNFAAKDARDLMALAGAGDMLPGNVQVRSVLDAEATRENILTQSSFLKDSAVDDIVIVFLAGHGFLDESHNYYFGTTDIDPDSPAARGLPYSALTDIVAGLPSRQRLVLLDSCHSGTIEEDAPRSAAGPVRARGFRLAGAAAQQTLQTDVSGLNQYFSALRSDSGAIVLAAAGGMEYAYESERWNNGVFTFALLEGLREGTADLDGDGSITAQELKRHVNMRVTELTGGGQSPVARDDAREIDFPLTYR